MSFVPEEWKDKSNRDSGFAIAVALMYCAQALDNMGLRRYADPDSGMGALEKIAFEHEILGDKLELLARIIEDKEFKS